MPEIITADAVTLRSRKGVEAVDTASIYKFHADLKYVSCFCSKGERLLNTSLVHIEKALSGHAVRISRSIVVMRSKVKALKGPASLVRLELSTPNGIETLYPTSKYRAEVIKQFTQIWEPRL